MCMLWSGRGDESSAGVYGVSIFDDIDTPEQRLELMKILESELWGT